MLEGSDGGSTFGHLVDSIMRDSEVTIVTYQQDSGQSSYIAPN